MKKYVILGLLGALVVAAVVIAWRAENTKGTHPLSEIQAREIAGESCVKGGVSSTGVGRYDSALRAWIFDANTNATRDGCRSLCVVSDETKRGVFVWECGG